MNRVRFEKTAPSKSILTGLCTAHRPTSSYCRAAYTPHEAQTAYRVGHKQMQDKPMITRHQRIWNNGLCRGLDKI